MGRYFCSTMELVNVRSSAWLEGMAAPAVDGPFGRLQRARIQGLSALVTPSWALDCGAEAAVWTAEEETKVIEAMRSARTQIAVYDLPAGMPLATDAFQGWFLERHTRMANLALPLPKHRIKQARKAKGLGLHVEFGHRNTAQMVKLHQLARSRKSIPSDGEALTKLLVRLAEEPGAEQAFVLDASGRPVAGGMFLTTQPDRLLYAFGGAERNAHSGLATVLLLVEAMQRAANQGKSYFDFGGSQDPGVDQFYREFGGEKVTKFQGVVCPPLHRLWLRFRRPDLFH